MFKPSHPDKVDTLPLLTCACGPGSNVVYIRMEDVDDPSIPKGMAIMIRRRQDHDISVGPRVDSVLFVAHIVCRVVDANSAVGIKPIIEDVDAVNLFL